MVVSMKEWKDEKEDSTKYHHQDHHPSNLWQQHCCDNWGKKENIENAFKYINLFIDDLNKKVLDDFIVEKKFHPFIKEIIKNLQEKFPPLSSKFDKICINGEKGLFMKVKNYIIYIWKKLEMNFDRFSVKFSTYLETEESELKAKIEGMTAKQVEKKIEDGNQTEQKIIKSDVHRLILNPPQV